MQKIINIISVLLMMSIAKFSHAQFYADCIAGNDFGNNSIDIVTLYPINPNCYQLCDIECGSFSREYLTQELNQPIIDACKTACQSGHTFSSPLYQEDKTTKPPSITDIQPGADPNSPSKLIGTTQASCNQDTVKDNVYQSTLLVNNGDTLVLSLIGGQAYNTIYLCGKSTSSLIPIFASTDYNEWDSSSQTWWKSPDKHVCLSYMNRGKWGELTNKDLWDLGYLPFTNNYPRAINYFPPPNVLRTTTNSTGLVGNGNGFSICGANESLNPSDLNKIKQQMNLELPPSMQVTSMTGSSSSGGACSPGGSSQSSQQNGLGIASSLATAGFPGVFSSADMKSPYGPCKWSARNYNFTSTGLWVADGDEISISWYGEYGHNLDGQHQTTNDFAQCMTDPNNSAESQNSCKQFLNLDSSIQLMMPSKTNSNNAFDPLNPYKILFGEQARTFPLGVNTSFSNNTTTTNSLTILGLTGSVLDHGMKIQKLDPSKYPNCSVSNASGTNSKCQNSSGSSSSEGSSSGGSSSNPALSEACNQLSQLNNPSCIQVLNLGTPTYTYSGNLKGFSGSRSPLAFRHYDDCNQQAICLTGSENFYGDNIGGYNITIKWGGCPFYNGDRVQYQVAKSYNDLSKDKWIDIPQDAFTQGKNITISSNLQDKGTMFFRIKLLSPPANAPPEVQALYTNPGNYFGKYYFSAQSKAKIGLTTNDGPLGDFVKTIHDTLIGNSQTGQLGAAEIIFATVTQGSDFIRFIMALLTFYIAFFAVGFLIGVIQLNQKEAVARISKMTIVLLLISPQSWSFFSTYLLNMFIEGGIQLITLMVSGTFEQSQVNVQQDPYAIFQLFDTPISQMFSSAVWKKIYGLVCTGLLGIFVAIIVIYCIIMYTLSLVKATLIYIFSLMGIAVLITTAPVFICCVLFQITREFFDRWWKYLISYTLQPVMVFATVAIFTLVLMALLMSALNFTVCSFCLLGIDLSPVYSACWIPGYHTTLAMNMPADVPNFYLPGNILSIVLGFALIANSMYKMMGIITQVCSILITGSFIRNITAAAPATKTMTTMSKTAQSAIKTATTMASSGIRVGGSVGGMALPGAGKVIAKQTSDKVAGGVDKAGAMTNKAIDSVVEDNGEKD